MFWWKCTETDDAAVYYYFLFKETIATGGVYLAIGIESFFFFFRFENVYLLLFTDMNDFACGNKKKSLLASTEIISKQAKKKGYQLRISLPSSDTKLAAMMWKRRPLTRACEDISYTFFSAFPPSGDVHHSDGRTRRKAEVIHLCTGGKKREALNNNGIRK